MFVKDIESFSSNYNKQLDWKCSLIVSFYKQLRLKLLMYVLNMVMFYHLLIYHTSAIPKIQVLKNEKVEELKSLYDNLSNTTK